MLPWNIEPTQIHSSGTPRPTTPPRTTTPIRAMVFDNPCPTAMTARIEHQDSQTAEPHCAVRTGEIGAVASLLGSPPEPIEIGAGAVVLLDGTLDVEGPPVDGLRIRLGELEQDVEGYGVPPPPGEEGTRWWASVEVPHSTAKGLSAVSLVADVGGTPIELDLGSLELIERLQEPEAEVQSESRIAICMATYEPAGDQLRRQIDSIRAQTRRDWICLISDDASSDGGVRGVAGGDRRRSALRRLPRGGAARLPPQLRALAADGPGRDRADRARRPGRPLGPRQARGAGRSPRPQPAPLRWPTATCGSPTTDGEILSETYWYLRRNSCDDIASMLVANTVTGAASALPPQLLDVALPFPPGNRHEVVYHDHWLALCALAGGEIAYLDRADLRLRPPPRLDHDPGSKRMASPAAGDGRSGAPAVAPADPPHSDAQSTVPSWRSIYLGRYRLIRQLAAMLELRLGNHIAADKRRTCAGSPRPRARRSRSSGSSAARYGR